MLNIVLIEDHDALREVMVEVLGAQGHRVVGLDCAEAMGDALGITPIDLLVVDLNLPGEDGYSLTQRFRTTHPLAGIIMVTARHEIADKVQGYDKGADVFLSKPVSPDELIAAVSSVARRLAAQAVRAEAGAPAQLRLDSRKLRLTGPLGETTLTDAEVGILSALARAPGQSLELWQILELLSIDMDTFNKSSFEVRIVRLRKKLILVGAEKTSLRVVRKSGYQLCAPLSIY